jgi:phosphate starvation-inducible protein PhoH
LRETRATEDQTLTLAFDDNRLLPRVFGEHDEHLALLEHRLGVHITPKGNRVAIRGGSSAAEDARTVLLSLYARASPSAHARRTRRSISTPSASMSWCSASALPARARPISLSPAPPKR